MKLVEFIDKFEELVTPAIWEKCTKQADDYENNIEIKNSTINDKNWVDKIKK